MGTAAKKKRPMRSRRSGVKKLNLVKSNLSILKKLVALFVLVLLFNACTPVRIVETTSIDSTGKQIKVKTKYYQQTDGYSVQPDIHIITTTPLFYNRVPIIIPTYRVPVIRGYQRNSFGFRHRH
jgi:hypothetical protein